MGSITDFLENELLDHVFNASYTPPSNLYLCLCTSDPTDAATGASMNEVSNANNYARAAIDFGTAASRSVTQNGAVTFNQASGSWGTVSHWAICDSNTYGSGNVLATGAFTTSKSIVSGNTPSVADAEIVISYSAGEISDYLALELLDHAFNNLSYTAPDTYVGLCTATIDDSDDGDTVTEVSGGSYAREQVNVNGGSSPTWDLAASGLVDNTHEVAFTEATASWGTVTSVGIFDAATSGNLLFYDNTMTDQAVASGDTASFPAGDLDISMT
jgi:hypothetical protein